MHDEVRTAAGARQTCATEMKLAEMPLLIEDLQERGLIEL
jgi:hypothetical protein